MSFPGEIGAQRYDGFYLLGSIKPGCKVEMAPGLKFIFTSEDNGGPRENAVVCVSFSVEGKNFPITLTNYDLSPTAFSHGAGVEGPQWVSFSLKDKMYRIIGTGSEKWINGETFLFYRLTR